MRLPWEQELAPLGAEMAYGVAKARPHYFGVHLFSKLPLTDPQVQYLAGSRNPSVFTGIHPPSGRAIKLYAIHPRPPLVGQSAAERNAQLMATALAAHDEQEPHVVVGDMNAVPWEGVIHQAQWVGRLLDPRIGRGLRITWNADSLVLKWPLDQILPGPDFTLLSLQVLPAFGSDHRPLLAELCLDPAARRANPRRRRSPATSKPPRPRSAKGKGQPTRPSRCWDHREAYKRTAARFGRWNAGTTTERPVQTAGGRPCL